MIYKTLPFIPAHAIQIKELEPGDLEDRETWASVFSPAHSRTLTADNKPIACGGFIPYWQGVGEVWCLYDETLCKHLKQTMRWTRDWLATITNEWSLKRIQTAVRIDNLPAINWMSHLGFSPESTLHKYGMDGTDSVLFTKIME